MSVIGISLSDIVGGVQAAKKAISALSIEDGAQVQYQAFKQSHHHLHAAVKALSDACSSLDVASSTELNQSLKHLLEKHERQNNFITKYEKSLGEGASLQRRKGIRQKLQWAFQEDKELRDSDARSRLAVDAAILQTLQVQNEIDQRDHTAMRHHVSSTAESAVNRLQENLDNLADHTSHLANEILTENKQQIQRLISILCSMDEAQKHPIAKSMRTMVINSATFPAGSIRKLQCQGRRKRICRRKSRSNQNRSFLSASSLPGSFPANYRCSSVPNSSLASSSASHPQIDDSCYMMDINRAFWALLFTVLYAHSQSQKLAGRLWMRVQADPMLALLCLLCAALVQRCLPRLPKHISLLSDNNVVFEDVFGIEIHVPYQRCEQFEFFHGFLEFYFRQKPGLQRVMKKQYRLLLGNARGQTIERATWTKTVKPKSRLTMAMLLISAQSQCAKCFGELKTCDEEHVRKCFACEQEYSVEVLSFSHQNPTPKTAINYQIGETEQLDLLPDHSATSNEEQTAADRMISLSNLEQALYIRTEELTATHVTDTKSSDSVIDTLHGQKSTAQENANSVHELELKLFKNIAIHVISSASSLTPMVSLARIPDDNISSTENPIENSPEESFEGTGLDSLAMALYRDLDELLGRQVHDDMAESAEPTRHVDHPGYDWDEKEVRLFWRYIVDRKKALANTARLENATWRVWAQKRASTIFIQPENTNWLKDCDVTWLYGPLQSDSIGLKEESHRRSLYDPGSLSQAFKKPSLRQKSASARLFGRRAMAAFVVAASGCDIKASTGFNLPTITKSNTRSDIQPYNSV